ncbi:MAG TPA: class I SAM-dependent methyltransferase [Chloroflexota bacterium]|nr:class I SAM-dependent methyltransferase [Chloroflexota bacterium]
MRTLIPAQADALDAILAALPFTQDTPLRVLNLAAGNGALAGWILLHFPAATAILAESSDSLAAFGSDKLRELGGRFAYVAHDIISLHWPAELAGPVDAVVSSQAIHHLPNLDKGRLFNRVAGVLVPGGVFLNFDLAKQPGQQFDDDDPHKTMATKQEWLGLMAGAGFEAVSVVIETPNGILVTGRKPA